MPEMPDREHIAKAEGNRTFHCDDPACPCEKPGRWWRKCTWEGVQPRRGSLWRAPRALFAELRETWAREREGYRIWSGARSYDDLCELTAQWCEGRLAYHPNGHSDGRDPETLLMADELAALNRAGFLTDNSQAAESYEYGQWGAWVEGYCSADLADRITRAAPPHVKVTVYHPPFPRGGQHAFGMFDHPNGNEEPARHTRSAIRNLQYAPVADEVVHAVLNSCQVHIEDTRPGVNDMWGGWLAEVVTGKPFTPKTPARDGGRPSGGDTNMTTPSRRWDRKPETEQDSAFFDQLEKYQNLPEGADPDVVLAEGLKLKDLAFPADRAEEGVAPAPSLLADRLNMTGVAGRKKLLTDASDEDLKAAVSEFEGRAVTMGKRDQISSPHKAILGEIARRAKAKSVDDPTFPCETGGYRAGDKIGHPEPPVGTALDALEDPNYPFEVRRYRDGWGIPGHHSRIGWRAARQAWGPFTVKSLPGDATNTNTGTPTSNAGGTMSVDLDLPAAGAEPSTFATVARTLRGAEETARRSAADWDARAEGLRAQAAALSDKPDLAETAAELLDEAARAAETADARRGRAAAYADKAAELEAQQAR
jgi:hypothetical protein